MTTALTIGEKYDKLKGLIGSMEKQLEMTLPKGFSSERFGRVALTSFRNDPKLMNCTPKSLMGTLMEASTLGLMLDGVTGEAYPVPFKNQCTLMLGYKGLIKLAYNTEKLKSIYARVVHKKDHFEYILGTEETIIHKPSLEKDPGPPVAFYSVAHLVGGGVKLEVMTKHEVDKIRAMSKQKNGLMWTDHYDEAGKKTVLRRNCKMLPASTELNRATSLDEMAEAGVPQNLPAGADFAVEGDEDRYPDTEVGRVDLKDIKKPAEQQAQSGDNAGASNPSGDAGAPDVLTELDKILAKEDVTGDDYGYAFELADPDKQFVLDEDIVEFVRRGDWYAAVRWIKRKVEGE